MADCGGFQVYKGNMVLLRLQLPGLLGLLRWLSKVTRVTWLTMVHFKATTEIWLIKLAFKVMRVGLLE
jgi:hypothetical protein